MVDHLLDDSVLIDHAERTVRIPGRESEVPTTMARRAAPVEAEKAETIVRRPKALDVDLLGGRGRSGAQRQEGQHQCNSPGHDSAVPRRWVSRTFLSAANML